MQHDMINSYKIFIIKSKYKRLFGMFGLGIKESFRTNAD